MRTIYRTQRQEEHVRYSRQWHGRLVSRARLAMAVVIGVAVLIPPVVGVVVALVGGLGR